MSKLDEDIAFLRTIGKCASKDQYEHLCTLSANHQGRNHKAQIIGGPEDGQTLAEWPW